MGFFECRPLRETLSIDNRRSYVEICYYQSILLELAFGSGLGLWWCFTLVILYVKVRLMYTETHSRYTHAHQSHLYTTLTKLIWDTPLRCLSLYLHVVCCVHVCEHWRSLYVWCVRSLRPFPLLVCILLCLSLYHWCTALICVCGVVCGDCGVWCVVVGDTWCGVVSRVYGHVGQQVCEVGNQRILPLHW